MSNFKAIERINEVIVRKENEIASLRFARDELSDPVWDERDQQDYQTEEGRRIVASLDKANQVDRQAAVHKDGCICPDCMPDHPHHAEDATSTETDAKSPAKVAT